ncbi:MAG: hypothetical protein OQJ81_07890 [Melioribacteraceae bacterium]|nr:hypothetical protein [Melioribacteraceae bacterium]
MHKYFVIILLFCSVTYAQYDINAGMGLNFFSSPDLRNYINANFATAEELQSFNTSADFFGEFGYNFNDQYQISGEYTFNIFSFNSNFPGGRYDLKINQHKPSIIIYYQIIGMGYKLKFGTGIGLRIAQVSEELYGSVVDYSTSGFGGILKAQGDTKLGGDFYALIAGEIRLDMPGEIETLTGGKFNINSFGVALKLGLAYYF